MNHALVRVSAFVRVASLLLALCAAPWAMPAAAHANGIDLRMVGPTGDVLLGQTIEVKLRANTNGQSFVGESFIAIDCILKWNPQHLKLLGITTAGSVPLLSSYLPSPANDYTGINEASPPADGTALYYALASFGNPIQVGPNGVQVVTFRFRVQGYFSATQVEVLPELTVNYLTETVVLDGFVAGLDVFGAGIPATITQVDCSAIHWWRDLDGDGYGDPNSMQSGCAQPIDHVDNDLDCDDTTVNVRPGAIERCSDLAIDNDCDGSTAESEAIDPSDFYADADADTFGAGAPVPFCTLHPGYSVNDDDCNDGDATVFPGAPEPCATLGIDNDCDGDLQDFTGAPIFYRDQDGDGAGDPAQTVAACSQPAGYVANANDQCPADPLKTAPGACGCGAADTDANGDLNPDCYGQIAALSMSPDRPAYRPGDTMRVRVSMGTAGVPIRGANVAAVFNPARLQFVDAVPVAGGPFSVETFQAFSNSSGTLRSFVAAPSDAAATTGPAPVVDLFFTVRPSTSSCSLNGLVAFGLVSGVRTNLPTLTPVPMTPTTTNLTPIAIDSIVPTLNGVPASASLLAQPGTAAGAFVPAPALSGTDNCGTPVISMELAYPSGATGTAWPAGGYFPPGLTTIVFRSTDAAGNAASATRTVTVTDYQLLDLALGLDGVVTGATTRSIRLRAGTLVQTLSVGFSSGNASILDLQLPVAAGYPCILIKDAQHSVTRAVAAVVAGERYIASATLRQGDSNDDDLIDVLDFGIFIGDIGYEPTRSGVSNFNGDLVVNSGDFSYIGLSFLSAGDACGGFTAGTPRERVSVRELRRRGLGELIRADLNGDGWLDVDDIAQYLAGQ
ncbi:MAG: MopE-related protein [Planctomycetota bacterium]